MSSEADAIVSAIIAKWCAGFATLDAAALSSLYAKNAFFFGSNPRLYRGRDGVADYFSDLPRWRLGDHLRQFEALGLRAEVLEAESLPGEFERVAPRLHPDFDRSDPNVAVAQATILVMRGA